MTRNLMIGLSLFTLTSASAIAAPAATTHHAKAKVVAQAPAGETPAPSADKPAKKPAKHTKAKDGKAKDTKADSKAETKGEMPSDAKAPEATKAK